MQIRPNVSEKLGGEGKGNDVLFLSRPVIRNVVFLNFLSYMIGLGHICAAVANYGWSEGTAGTATTGF